MLLWSFVAYCVLEEDSDTTFGDWKTWVTEEFTWLYIISQEIFRSSCRPCDQDYWLLYLFPLVYYYGDMKLGQERGDGREGILLCLRRKKSYVMLCCFPILGHTCG